MIQIAGKYHSTKLEGGDAVGKETLSEAIVCALLQLGYPVVKTNFPQYWFTGTMIRNFLRKKDSNVYLENLPPTRSAQIRAAAYALDRAMSLSLLLPILEQNPEIKHISDRGPMSNIVSAAYIWHQNPQLTEADLTEFMENIFPYIEIEMRQELGDEALLCLTGEQLSSSIHARENLDLYDTPDVQQRAAEIYMQHIPSSNHIMTKQNGMWRPIQDSTADALAAMGVETNSGTIDVTPESRNLIIPNALRSGQLQIVGPQQFMDLFLNKQNLPHDLVDELPRLQRLANEWLEVTMTPEEDLPSENGVKANKKTFMEIQEKLFYAMALGFFARADLTQTNIHPAALTAICRLLSQYPELLDLIAMSMGNDTASQFEVMASMASEA